MGFKYFPQRRAEKEQQQFLKELEALTGGIEDDGEEDLSLAVLPDYTMGRNEKARVIRITPLLKSKVQTSLYGHIMLSCPVNVVSQFLRNPN